MKPAGCAIDFGTSNSAIALPGAGLVEVEPGQRTMPTAVFYAVEEGQPGEPERSYGRVALASYIDGLDGRLMRSMKSVLGSTLVDQHTDVGGGKAVRYLDVIGDYLRHLKKLAEATAGEPLQRVVLGRPVAFVDDDAERDAQAQASLERAARSVGFTDVSFQLEPIAAAFDFERTAEREHLVMVADIGGGTSDFSLVRVGPERRQRLERLDDVLANHGVHIAGTDFDRHLELSAILPLLGYRSLGPGGREVPNKVYFDLATWHLINTVYSPGRVAELRRMRDFYGDAQLHQRLMRAVSLRLGHALAAKAEEAKIAVAEGGAAPVALDDIEPGLHAVLDEATAMRALDADLQRIVDAGVQTAREACVRPDQVDVLYFTGGSTGLAPLADRIAAEFPNAQRVKGDRFASVAQGLGEHARRLWGG